MSDENPTGRARVRRPTHGRARVGRSVGKAQLPERAVTEVVKADVPDAKPVFVDPSGARRKRMRWSAYAAGAVLILVLLVIWLSQLSGPAQPPVRTPCPQASAAKACDR
jgi:hypothetical protein